MAASMFVFFLTINLLLTNAHANPDAKRLYDDLMSSYNSVIRPVRNSSDTMIVKISLKLSQLIDVNLKNQIMSTNLWIEQEWVDYNLRWDPGQYGGVTTLYVPSEQIWLPDIVLFNNADGNYDITQMTKAILHHDGKVVWNPPAMYKSTCEIDVEFFPFDVQSCLMKFGSWTYDGHEVDIRHVQQVEGSVEVLQGIDMSEFYKSVEWDFLLVPARYNEEFYPCCPEPYPDLTFNITMRRKTLFYTVNLIIPCVGISFLTVLVFYLPSDCGEKVTLSISILVALTVFFLLLAEIIPPTSLAVPLLGKYLLFTMILVTLSICVTVGVLNIYFRSPSTHKMSPWVRTVFINILPRLMGIKRPTLADLELELAKTSHNSPKGERRQFAAAQAAAAEMAQSGNEVMDGQGGGGYNGLSNLMDEDILAFPEHSLDGRADDLLMSHELGLPMFLPPIATVSQDASNHKQANWNDRIMSQEAAGLGASCPGMKNAAAPLFSSFQYSPEVQKAIESILYIADHIKKEDDDNNVIEDWKYVAMVVDRLFLWIFTMACLIGTCGIILQAPSLYDQRIPIDSQLSQIGR